MADFTDLHSLVEDLNASAHHRPFGGIRDFRSAESGCAQRTLARQNDVAGQAPFFGKFPSHEEAEKWIEQHRWLTEQRQKPDVSLRNK